MVFAVCNKNLTKFFKLFFSLVLTSADEAASGTSTKGREGFNRMIKEALAGKLDLIISKSVSRFARNTVDSLSTIRKLKDAGCECYFEKENIFTFDGKGELLITIMSSLAQEESRSISENVRWGARKRMADGKVSMAYSQFLGYERGEDGVPQVVPEEAETVRQIFKMFMEGKTFSSIARYLTDGGIPTPAGKKVWQTAVIRSILQNEKFKGHALLQKTFCEDFLTKKVVKNTGQIPKFYVEESHPHIIEPDEFDVVQAEIRRRKELGRPMSCGNIFAARIICGDCGQFYGAKTWGSYRDDKKYRRVVFICNDKYKGEHRCETPHFTEEQIKTAFLAAFNKLMVDRDRLLEDCYLAMKTLFDTAKINAEIDELEREIEVVSQLSRSAIYENARSAINQTEWNERNQAYLERHRAATEKVSELERRRGECAAKAKTIELFINEIKRRTTALFEFDESLWMAAMENVKVGKDGGLTFRFKNGSEILIKK